MGGRLDQHSINRRCYGTNGFQSLTTSRNRLNLTLLYVSITTIFLYFRQFPKLSFKKSIDLSRILGLFITTTIFTGSECFLVDVRNTVILTGYTSSQKVFHDILANSGVKKSIMGQLLPFLFLWIMKFCFFCALESSCMGRLSAIKVELESLVGKMDE